MMENEITLKNSSNDHLYVFIYYLVSNFLSKEPVRSVFKKEELNKIASDYLD